MLEFAGIYKIILLASDLVKHGRSCFPWKDSRVLCVFDVQILSFIH